MWALKNELTGDVFHFLSGREYSVGRKDCDITIVNDISISRKHAVFRVLQPESSTCDPSKTSSLLIKDVSKFGVHVRNDKIDKLERVVRSGDPIVFGTGNSNKFSVVFLPLLVTTSCISSQLKKDIKKMVLKLGGNVVNEWCVGCTHVVMSNLSVTIKVMCALLSQAFVVNATYLKDLLATIEKGTYSKLPPVEDYLPTMAESQIGPGDVAFSPTPKRSTLFFGKVFIYLVRDQFARLSTVVELGGGHNLYVDATEKLQESHETLLLNENNCVLLPDSGESHRFKSVSTLLRRHKLRMIPESEVGFAVLYCSTESHCNASQVLRSSQAVGGFEASQSCSATEVSQDLFSNPSVYSRGANDKMRDENLSTANFSVPSSDPAVHTVPDSQPELVVKSEPSKRPTVQQIVQETEYQSMIVEPCKNLVKKEKAMDLDEDNLTAVPRLNAFLPSDRPNVEIKDENFGEECSLEGVVVVEERNLLNRRRPPVRTGVTDCEGGVMWNGRLVKNFKRFHKSGRGARIGSIPPKKLICREDLTPHVNADVYDGVTSQAFERFDFSL